MRQSFTQRAQLWQQILDFTRQMRALSIEKGLVQLLALQQQRQDCIEAFFASPIMEDEAEQVSAGIREILDSDQLIYQKGDKIKSDIGESLQKAMGNRKALDAYQGVGQT